MVQEQWLEKSKEKIKFQTSDIVVKFHPGQAWTIDVKRFDFHCSPNFA